MKLSHRQKWVCCWELRLHLATVFLIFLFFVDDIKIVFSVIFFFIYACIGNIYIYLFVYEFGKKLSFVEDTIFYLNQYRGRRILVELKVFDRVIIARHVLISLYSVCFSTCFFCSMFVQGKFFKHLLIMPPNFTLHF